MVRRDDFVKHFLTRALKPLEALAIAVVCCLGCASRSTDTLVADLQDDDEYIRAKAASELAMRKDPLAIEPLIAALSDKNEDVRWEASLALEAFGRTALAPLSVALASKDSTSRRESAAVLFRMYERTHDGGLSKLFAEALANKDYAIIAGAYRYYLRGEIEGAEPDLISALYQYGTSGMAADFANCGKGRLGDAARKWASDHHYSMVPAGSRQVGAVRKP
jgi:hypothetical protein